MLNRFYLKLNYGDLKLFHTLYSKIFKSGNYPDFDAEWVITFADIEIKMPLKGNTLWLDWDTAVSIKGHDIEVKSFYEKLILSPYRPSVFFDIGANYGTHSILFLANGIKTISFEPNPFCHDDLDRMAKLNNLSYHLEKFAVGSEITQATLQFPERDTWLGSLSKEKQDNILDLENVRSVDVNVITLDQYTESNNIFPDLIKIDTEGFELNVIRGGRSLLSNKEVIVIFECNDARLKPELYDEFSDLDYMVFNLNNLKDNNLSAEAFLSCKGNNYLALKHKSHIIQSLHMLA